MNSSSLETVLMFCSLCTLICKVWAFIATFSVMVNAQFHKKCLLHTIITVNIKNDIQNHLRERHLSPFKKSNKQIEISILLMILNWPRNIQIQLQFFHARLYKLRNFYYFNVVLYFNNYFPISFITLTLWYINFYSTTFNL